MQEIMFQNTVDVVCGYTSYQYRKNPVLKACAHQCFTNHLPCMIMTHIFDTRETSYCACGVSLDNDTWVIYGQSESFKDL